MQKAYLSKPPGVSRQKPEFFNSKSEKMMGFDFFFRKKLSKISSGHVEWSFGSAAKSISAKIQDLSDGTTKRNNFFSTKKPQSFLGKTWHGLATKLLKFFNKKRELFCSGPINPMKLFFSKKSTFSNSPFGRKECSFLNPDETFSDLTWSFSCQKSKNFPLQFRKKMFSPELIILGKIFFRVRKFCLREAPLTMQQPFLTIAFGVFWQKTEFLGSMSEKKTLEFSFFETKIRRESLPDTWNEVLTALQNYFFGCHRTTW